MLDETPRPSSAPELTQAHYSDGHPLDQIHYLEAKLILKPRSFHFGREFSRLR